MAKLKVEIAATPAELAHGLMGRQELPWTSGVLFKFPGPVEAAFWGKNTYIPLDIAFVDANNKITEIKQIVPMSTRLVKGVGYSQMAIEANQGFFTKNSIAPGSYIDVVPINGSQEFEVLFNVSRYQ